MAEEPSIADELGKLAELHGRGVLTDDEFARQKAVLLGPEASNSQDQHGLVPLVITEKRGHGKTVIAIPLTFLLLIAAGGITAYFLLRGPATVVMHYEVTAIGDGCAAS
ncbi:MAG TPA: SHOCT domain-containing protein, partial [Acidimicrobiales bacterium]|nr:SHOCT domain-containing protein [Acidimicrobiales bacterium]